MIQIIFNAVTLYLVIGVFSAIHAYFWGKGYAEEKELRYFAILTIVLWPCYWED